MIQTLTEALEPRLRDAIDRIAAPLDQLSSWDYSVAVMPVGPNQFASFGLFTLLARSPLLGAPNLVATDIRPLDQFVQDQPTIDAMVREALNNIRNIRAAVLKGTG